MFVCLFVVQFGYEFFDFIQNLLDFKVVLMIFEVIVCCYVVVLVRFQGNLFVVVMKDLCNVFVFDDFKLIIGKEILFVVMVEKDIICLIECYFGEKGFEKFNKEFVECNKIQQLQEVDFLVVDESVIVQVVDLIICEVVL